MRAQRGRIGRKSRRFVSLPTKTPPPVDSMAFRPLIKIAAKPALRTAAFTAAEG
jgi:hypothetical protein